MHVLEATYSSSATHHGQKNRGRVRGYFSLIITTVYAFANKNKYDSLFSISTLTSTLTLSFSVFRRKGSTDTIVPEELRQ